MLRATKAILIIDNHDDGWLHAFKMLLFLLRIAGIAVEGIGRHESYASAGR